METRVFLFGVGDRFKCCLQYLLRQDLAQQDFERDVAFVRGPIDVNGGFFSLDQVSYGYVRATGSGQTAQSYVGTRHDPVDQFDLVVSDGDWRTNFFYLNFRDNDPDMRVRETARAALLSIYRPSAP